MAFHIKQQNEGVYSGSRKNAPPPEICPQEKYPPENCPPPKKKNFVNLPHVIEYFKGENFVKFHFRQS